MKLARFTDWAERRAMRQGSAANVGRALLATLWVMFGGPVFWIILTPAFGDRPDAVFYALASAIVLSMAGYAGTLFLLRRWSR